MRRDGGLAVYPGSHDVTDALSDGLGLALGATDAQAGRPDAGMQFLGLERLGRPLAGTFDDMCHDLDAPCRRHHGDGHDVLDIQVKSEDDEPTSGGELQETLVRLAPFLDPADTVSAADQAVHDEQ